MSQRRGFLSAAPTGPTGEEQRAQALLGMGFNATQALLLAATQHEGEHANLERVQWMLEAGCAHELAMRILV
jgi:hypothetical protein